jgi:hypothetical protein
MTANFAAEMPEDTEVLSDDDDDATVTADDGVGAGEDDTEEGSP